MFKQAKRNAVLLSIGQGKRISLETNLVSKNESAIYSKGRQFRLSARNTTPFLGMQTKMAENRPAWRSGKARNLVPRVFVPLDKGREEGSGHEIVNGAEFQVKVIPQK